MNVYAFTMEEPKRAAAPLVLLFARPPKLAELAVQLALQLVDKPEGPGGHSMSPLDFQRVLAGAGINDRFLEVLCRHLEEDERQGTAWPAREKVLEDGTRFSLQLLEVRALPGELE